MHYYRPTNSRKLLDSESVGQEKEVVTRIQRESQHERAIWRGMSDK